MSEKMSYQLLSETRPTDNRSPDTLIHNLDNDSLLIIFSLCRQTILDEVEISDIQLLEGGEWNHERWWYRLVQVCRRWRYIFLESASHLRLSLVCTRGTPVANMLAHSPPLPIIIDHFYGKDDDITAEDEEGIFLALQHRGRVRRIRLMNPIPILQKLIIALNGEFPILQYLLIWHQRYHDPTIENIVNLNFPEAFWAPNLRQLVIENFATPIESPLLTTMGNLTTLYLGKIPSSAYFHPNALLQRLSLMPQLVTLGVTFNCYNPSRDIERQLSRARIMTQVTLPNLRYFTFGGINAYLEELLSWATIPLLERLDVYFFNRMMYTIPRLRQFMSTTRNLRLKTATLTFDKNCLVVVAYPHKEARFYSLCMQLGGRHLDWQVVSAAQVFHALKTVFSAVEHLTLKYDRHDISSEWNRQADRTHWRELLGSFSTVKTIRVEDGLVEQVSLALQPGDGESSTELLPELQELSSSKIGSSRDVFNLFKDARQKVGRTVNVLHF
jgi:hypothetical protein